MQKKTVKRYSNRLKYKEYNISHLPYTKEIEDIGICVIFKTSKK